jgi:cytochrome c-type biogenesis protein CcmH/NrfG
MAKKQKIPAEGQYVRKETFLIVTLLSLAIGFFGGVMFAVYKSDSDLPAVQVSQGSVQPGRTDMIAALEKKVQADPQNVEAWTGLGNAYFDANQHEKAIGAYKKSLELNPANANVWTDMGIMYRRSGDSQEAIKAFDKAIAVDPKHEISRMNKGIVLLHDLNDTQGAIRAWEGLLAVNPVAVAPNGQSIDQMVAQLKKTLSQQGPAQQ